MTNKKQLQKEIKDEGYFSDNQSNKSRNKKNLVSNKTIQQLEQERNFEAKKAQNYLEQITKLTAELDSANLEIQELKKIKPTKTQTELEKALIEANQKIRDQAKTIQDLDYLLKTGKNSEIIKKLEGKVKEQYKTIEDLQKQVKITRKNEEEIKEPINKSFFCDGCQLTKQGTYIKRKIDSPFEPRIHGRTCYLCSSCSPYYKELNDTTFDKDNNPYKLY